jgi:hypothetical protein
MRLGIEPARFIPRLIFALALCLPLWILLVPTYNRILAVGLSLTLPLVGEQGRVGMVWKDYVLVSPPESDGSQRSPKMEGFRGYLGHYNAPLFVALILATPGLRISERLKALVPGGLVLYALHLTYMILELKHLPYVRSASQGAASGWGYRWGVELYLVIAAQLSPILLWFIFLRYRERRKQVSHEQQLPPVTVRKGRDR